MPRIGRDRCGILLHGGRLFAGDRLTTGRPGQLDFRTNSIPRCTMRADTVDVVAPDTRTALRHLRGTVICQVAPGTPDVTITLPGFELEVMGTLFSVTVTEDGTTIKVVQGRLTVRSIADSRSVIIRDKRQIFAPAGQKLPRVSSKLTFTDAGEKEFFDAVRLDVVTVGPNAVPDFLASMSRKSAAVVAQTAEPARAITERSPALNLVPFKAAAVRKSSFRQSLQPIGNTVICVGSFQALLPTIERLRRDLGDAAVIAYAPSPG